ncbi:MAG TPA: polyribonucleotide nucleotidyltransferase, partial [Firmicutes bacterium]|nr:polyribonucleotide nucleotidyltransferase [Bacillota bacterium]
MGIYNLPLQERMLTLETGRLAQQASGAVLVKYGETVVLVAVTISDEPREGIDFFPLTVDYEERLYAVGKIPGGFIKREGRPTEKAILSARLTDRSLRPLFPRELRNSVHVVTTVLSVDQDCPPEILSIIGASAALSISKIPFSGPLGAVVVGLIDGQPIINPTLEQSQNSKLHLVLAGTKDAVMMVEAEASEVTPESIIECLEAGKQEISRIVALQEEMVDLEGIPKMEVAPFEPSSEIRDQVFPVAQERIRQAMVNPDKLQREEHLKQVKQDMLDEYLE